MDRIRTIGTLNFCHSVIIYLHVDDQCEKNLNYVRFEIADSTNK